VLRAHLRAEELRSLAGRALADLVGASAPPRVVTLSVGVAAYPFNGLDADGLLKAVDAALYTAKSHGRDCVSVAAPAEHVPRAATPSWPGPACPSACSRRSGG
jgi:GGDEF domain-containing protein